MNHDGGRNGPLKQGSESGGTAPEVPAAHSATAPEPERRQEERPRSTSDEAARPQPCSVAAPAAPDGDSEVALTSGPSQQDEALGQEQPPAQMASKSVVLHTVRRLPNCKITGVDYQASLADVLSRFSPTEVTGIGIDHERTKVDFELHLDSKTCEISCHPEQAGEFEIDLCIDVVRSERHIFPFRLTVNPDPKTLWRNIPSDQNGIYAKPDSARMFLDCGQNLSIVAASQRGRSHAQEGKPRDDHFLAEFDPETECAVLIVADGAGSAKFSREGSRLAAQTARDEARSAMTSEYWRGLVPMVARWAKDKDSQAERAILTALYKVLVHGAWQAKAMIKKEAQSHEARYLADYKKAEKFTSRDYATTLIVTIVKKIDGLGWFVATFWVGDGGMGVYRSSAGEVRVQGSPDGGDYGGQTRFLTEDSAEVWPQDANRLIARRLRFDVVDSFDAVVLMTDGVSDPKFETENNLVSFMKWNELWADLRKEVPLERRDGSVSDALLRWMDFWSPGNHDDRTMVVLY